ncbi:PREDICTED: uncharacterized protein LOC107192871 [Dufourea novaeangliae]|uniref:uncharacterized protein LOC107192871 n=1 Tax=Dufourea novaeangliae TaxID=178035 RepID=UPI000766F29C|nr:PREDICTED: uncharacterized protein LOC107192871 [Dufourea novaeangliae]
MAHITEVKFSDLQTEERYKRLERSLKLGSLKKGNRQEGDELWHLPMSPSISSINVDGFDSSSNVPSLQSSCIYSEVVASSKNLRNIVLNSKNMEKKCKNIATSSVKKFDKTNGLQEDHFIMPPPNFNRVLHASKKSNVISKCSNTGSTSVHQSECTVFDTDQTSPKRTILGSLQIGSDVNVQQNRKIRIFSDWKVTLNEQGQLIIKGTIETGQFARSKPIIRRWTSTMVQSTCKHMYQLEGNIVDDEHELPDYVSGKFYNGFPDDWENVYQIWRTFVEKGSILSFRWPAAIADSDDSLRSEVTDITFSRAESPESKSPWSKSFNDSHVSQIIPSNVMQVKEDEQNCTPIYHRMCNSSTQTYPSDIELTSQQNNDTEHCMQLETVASNCSYNEDEAKKLALQLSVIVGSLSDKNCSQKFYDTFASLLDCMRSIVLHGSVKNDESNTEVSESVQNKSMRQEKNNANGELGPLHNSKNTTIHHNQIYPAKTGHVIPDNGTIACNGSLLQIKASTKVDNCKNQNTSDSESEIYAGIPKIQAKRIFLQKKERQAKHCKYKARMKLMHWKNDVEKKLTSNVRPVSSENINTMYHNDSSVTIIDDKIKVPEVRKVINAKGENNGSKNINPLDKVLRGQQEESNVLLEDRNREMQEHFVQVNSTAGHKFAKNLCVPFNAKEYNSCDINGTKQNKNEMTENLFQNKSFEKENHINHHQNEASRKRLKDRLSHQSKDAMDKISKPIVISSVPVDVHTVCGEVNQLKKLSVTVKKLEDEIQQSVKENSRFKKHHAPRNMDSVSFIENSIEDEKSGNPAQIRARDLKDGKDSGNCKVKLLANWTPNVICDSKPSLIFEGKLLNDVGHVVNRTFKTDAVLCRVSLKLIETINHERYELVGDLNDTKHVVPKELVSQCRYGCPRRIEEFCKSWKLLQSNVKRNTALDNTMDSVQIGKSSKGRRIVPPLNFWTGERITVKDNNPVYTPGSLQELPVMPTRDNTSKNSFEKSKNSSASVTEKATNNGSAVVAKVVEKERHDRSRPRKQKRRLVTRMVDSSDSSDSRCSPVKKRQRGHSVDATEKCNNEQANAEKSKETKMTSEPINPIIKSGIKPSTSPIQTKQMSMDEYPSSTETYNNGECLYYQSFQFNNDTLSEDEKSHV